MPNSQLPNRFWVQDAQLPDGYKVPEVQLNATLKSVYVQYNAIIFQISDLDFYRNFLVALY